MGSKNTGKIGALLQYLSDHPNGICCDDADLIGTTPNILAQRVHRLCKTRRCAWAPDPKPGAGTRKRYWALEHAPSWAFVGPAVLTPLVKAAATNRFNPKSGPRSAIKLARDAPAIESAFTVTVCPGWTDRRYPWQRDGTSQDAGFGRLPIGVYHQAESAIARAYERS